MKSRDIMNETQGITFSEHIVNNNATIFNVFLGTNVSQSSVTTPPGRTVPAVTNLTARAQEHMRIFNYPKGKSRMGGKGKLPVKKDQHAPSNSFALGILETRSPHQLLLPKLPCQTVVWVLATSLLK